MPAGFFTRVLCFHKPCYFLKLLLVIASPLVLLDNNVQGISHIMGHRGINDVQILVVLLQVDVQHEGSLIN